MFEKNKNHLWHSSSGKMAKDYLCKMKKKNISCDCRQNDWKIPLTFEISIKLHWLIILHSSLQNLSPSRAVGCTSLGTMQNFFTLYRPGMDPLYMTLLLVVVRPLLSFWKIDLWNQRKGPQSPWAVLKKGRCTTTVISAFWNHSNNSATHALAKALASTQASAR